MTTKKKPATAEWRLVRAYNIVKDEYAYALVPRDKDISRENLEIVDEFIRIDPPDTIEIWRDRIRIIH